jgi:uncharacterized protein YjbI with pentapeptide repeats
MDRDEAIRLLKGGPDGVREWNERRGRGEGIPDLRGAHLAGARLGRADLPGAHLVAAELHRAVLSGVDLRGADLAGARLGEADLAGAHLERAHLGGADLAGAFLGCAHLVEADLRDARLSGAVLIGADLSGANLGGANLIGARLGGANLSGADLSGANLGGASMVQTDLRGAKLHDCFIFGISAWRIVTDEQTEQANLVISHGGDPILTVDNLKVAQFIDLLLNNAEIRQAIDTITSKVVLILGRFTPERKALLDAVREALRHHDYLPILFDFQGPASRGFTETVSTLARMARFVVADLTDATEVRQELRAIVPDLPSVPVQPLILASQAEFVTFQDFRPYTWVGSPHETDHKARLARRTPCWTEPKATSGF